MKAKTPQKFTHLHVHTHYSLLDGLVKVEDLLNKVEELGMDSIAITDHGTMYGVIDFYEQAKKRGIKPIIGCETYLAPNGMENKRPKIDEERTHLTLLAETNEGYRNLMKLITEAHLKGYYYKPRIDMEILAKHSKGIIALSGCVGGEVPRLIVSNKYDEAKEKALEYRKIMGENNYFLELQHLPNLKIQQKANEGLIQISKETGIPLVATADIHYANPDDNKVQDILVCIQTNRKIDDEGRMSMADNELYIKSPEEMISFFSDIPEAIENTQKIAERCTVDIKFGETILPQFKVPEGKTDDQYLRELCEKGIEKRYTSQNLDYTKEHQERLDFELGIISKMGFSSYFLIVQDFINWAKDNGVIVGPGRGSAAGSFVSYLTGITNIDPVKYDLLFERFLNPDRISMPDIDIDFADHRRDEVLNYVRRKYGEDKVAQIITFGTMAARAAVRDAGRVLGVEYAYCDKLAKMIPAFTKLKEALETSSELVQEYKNNPDAKKIIDSALRLEGVARHASVHACGVVITKDPVVTYSPLQYMAGRRGSTEQIIVTQYSAASSNSYVEKIGLLKMDFLGLKNLTIIENTLKIIKKTAGEEIDIETIPIDDQKAFDLLQKGDTTGIFQLESSGMKRYLKKLKPTEFEDIIAMVALYRPGPMEWIPDFIDGKHGKKRTVYLHPKLEPILKKTYGVAVYQEQVMQIAREIAGFSPGEADVLRKAMGKKIAALIQEEKKKFIDGCKSNDIDQKLAEKIFSFIEPFAGYGFNRSHAACYALIGYQTAYLKAHFPVQFMAALLNSDKDDIDRIAIEIEEARAMDIEVLPPDVNESFNDFSVVVDQEKEGQEKFSKIRFGLEAIKGVGAHIAEMIIEERKKNGPYKDIVDLVERVQDKDLNKKSIEALAMAGALDNLTKGNRNLIIKNIETLLSYAKAHQKQAASGQSSLFSLGTDEQKINAPKLQLEEVPPVSKQQRLSWEKELMGLYISDHPLREYQDYFAQKTIPIRNLDASHVNQNITVGGIITKIQKIYTRNNQLMYFATIEDGIGKLEILVFPKVLEKTKELWKEENIILAKGKLSEKDGEYKILLDDGIVVDAKELKNFKKTASKNAANGINNQNGFSANNKKVVTKPLKIIINIGQNCRQETLQKISDILQKTEKGRDIVYLVSNETGPKLEIPQRIRFEQDLVKRLEELIGEGKIKFS